MDRQARADALVRATLSLLDADLRSRYVASLVRAWPIGALAETLDAVCERAEQAEVASREALIAIVDALNGEDMGDLVQRLHEHASGDSLLALERLIRLPPRSHRPCVQDALRRSTQASRRRTLRARRAAAEQEAAKVRAYR